MITVSSTRLIKRFDFDLNKMNVSYLIKSFLCILQNEQSIEIIILKKSCDNE